MKKRTGVILALPFLALAILQPQPVAAQTIHCGPNPQFGLNYDDQSQPPAVLTTAMSKIYGANTGSVRIVALWKLMEIAQGAIDFSALDNRVNAAYSAGLRIVITFYGIPNWANGSPPACDFWQGQCSAPPTSSTYFGNFASAVANRYRTKVFYYEIWNEPDENVFWTGTVAQLSSLMVHPAAVPVGSVPPDGVAVALSATPERVELATSWGPLAPDRRQAAMRP